jgi:hypothetical protein
MLREIAERNTAEEGEDERLTPIDALDGFRN